MKRTTRSAVSALHLLAVTSALLVATAGSARADAFNPENSAPTVTLDTTSLAMQPATDGTSDSYTVRMTVGDADTLADLEAAGMCLYVQGVGDPLCETPDPTNEVALFWNGADDTFGVDDGGTDSFWSDQGSSSTYAPTATSMTMTFKFSISEAAVESDTWALMVAASDGDALTVVDDTTDFTVSYFGNVDLKRAAQDFGTVAAGGSAAANDIGATYMANGQSDIGYQLGSDFTDEAEPPNVAITATGTPGTSPVAGEVAFDCSPGAVFNQGTAARIGTPSLTDIEEDVFAGGLPEGGTSADAAAKQSCRLSNGGGLPRSGTPYQAGVITTIHADD